MKLAIVTNYPPDRRPLSEYGFHLANGLRDANPDGQVIVIAGKMNGVASSDGVVRAWSYGEPTIPWQIIRALKRLKVDGVLFSTHFTMWGSTLANFLGLITPWIASRKGIPTITLLHHIPQTIDVPKVGYSLTSFHRLAIESICRLLSRSGPLCFTLERDRDYFDTHYRAMDTHLVPLGTHGKPEWSTPQFEGQRILTIGNWGRGKDPEPVIRAFLQRPIGTLVVAGQSSHTMPGFLERIRSEYEQERVIFPGYIPEHEVPQMFRAACLVILPCKEPTGFSAVLMQACQYGRPLLIRRAPLFEKIARDLDLKLFFYNTEDELPELLPRLFSSPQVLVDSALHNYKKIKPMGMDAVAKKYWKLLSDLRNVGIIDYCKAHE